MQRWKLVAAVATVAAVVIASVIVLLLTSTTEQAARPTQTPSETTGPRVQPPMDGPSVSPTPVVENRPSGADQTNQMKVCNNYMDVFLQPGSPEERSARLKEWGTPQNVEQAKLAARLPNAKRKGDCAADPGSARENQAQLHVQLTDGTWWAMTLVKDLTVSTQWRVHAVTREGH